MQDTIFSESIELAILHRSNCQDFIKNGGTKEEIDYANFLISLHIVLEISLSGFYRQLFHFINAPTPVQTDRIKANEAIDNISFIDKTCFFIFCLPFKFPQSAESKNSISLISKLKKFCEPRNKLLHGQSISTLFIEGGSKKLSQTKKIVTYKKCADQINLFNEIMKTISCHLDWLDLKIMTGLKDNLKDQYLKNIA